LRTCREMIQRHLQPMFYIPFRKRNTAAEILQSAGFDPWVMLRPVGKAVFMNFWREHLRQR